MLFQGGLPECQFFSCFFLGAGLSLVGRKAKCKIMNTLFAETLKKLRKEKGISQIQLGKLMFVNNATISKWESGSRLPDASMITRLAKILDVDTGTLLSTTVESNGAPDIIMVEDHKAILSYSLRILEQVIPNAVITGFNWPQEAIEYAKANQVDLAFLDIELGTESGLDLCHTLLNINPCTNVVYLTAYPDYSLSAWDTDAIGFMVKPLTVEGVRRHLKKLSYPFQAESADR